jgi:MoaA/NifB/PqqE/SkfB family radical SAM enzyme
MTINQPKMFAPSKVNLNTKKVKTYLTGEHIFPTTVELDLTQLCVRSCPGCPYLASRRAGLTLQLPFLDRLFSIIGPKTPGIVITGGEATIVPHFPEVVALAKKRGFKAIAVISNGANIHHSKVQDALLEHVTSIRISMYDWQENNSDWFINTLHKIEGLRNRIEKEGSNLEIGASILTSKKWNHRYESAGRQALNAGIDWLYFHPYCIDWEKEYPTQADQSGVLEAIEKLKESTSKSADIQIPVERYDKNQLYFEKLHGAHFLLQVGADGINYAAPECKYEKDAELVNLNNYLDEDFLWHPQRLKRIDEINSKNYRFIGTKHRPPMFSDYIQKLIHPHTNNNGGEILRESSEQFKHPDII